MMRIRAESHISGTNLHALSLSEWLIADQSFDRGHNGSRIVQCSERIHTYIESKILQLPADIVCEAASKHQDLVLV